MPNLVKCLPLQQQTTTIPFSRLGPGATIGSCSTPRCALPPIPAVYRGPFLCTHLVLSLLHGEFLFLSCSVCFLSSSHTIMSCSAASKRRPSCTAPSKVVSRSSKGSNTGHCDSTRNTFNSSLRPELLQATDIAGFSRSFTETNDSALRASAKRHCSFLSGQAGVNKNHLKTPPALTERCRF